MAFKTLAYVTNAGDNNVSVIDTITNKVEYNISLEPEGKEPSDIAITPDMKYGYTTNDGTNNVSVININDKSVEYTIPVQAGPSSIAITPNGNFAYVTNYASHSVSVIDIMTTDVVNISLLPDGIAPFQVAITPDGKFAYVVNVYSNNVSIIDTSNNEVQYTINLEGRPSGIAITSDGKFAYVTSYDTNNVFVVNINEKSVEYTIPVGVAPFGIAITPDGQYGYVTNTGSDDVSVINISKNEQEYTISVKPDGDGPLDVAITPDGKYAYVINAYSDNVSVIDISKKEVEETIAVGARPSGIAMVNVPIEGISDLSVSKIGFPNPVVAGEELTYTITVRNSGPDRATGVTLIDRLPIGVSFVSAKTSHGSCSEEEGVVTCEIGSLGVRESALVTIVIIPNQGGTISNTATVKGNEVDPNPDNNTDVEITTVLSPIPTLKTFAYVTNSGSNDVSVINLKNNSIEGGPIYVGEQPYDVAITPNGKFAYIVNYISNDVYVVNTSTNKVVGFPIKVGRGPYGIDITPLGNFAYVTNINSDNVYIINTDTNAVVGNPITVGDGPVKIAITPNGRYAYVTNYYSNNVSVIDIITNKVIGNPIFVGANPFDIDITPNGKFAYVTSLGTDKVYVIDTSTNTVVGDAIPVGDGPFGITINPEGTFAYVANYYSRNVYVIDIATNTVVGNPISVTGPIDIAITRDGSFAYVVNYNTNDVSVIDTSTNTVIIESIPVGVYPRAIAIAQNLILGTETADLSVTKTESKDPIKLGDELTYTAIVTNNGPDTATAVILKDTLPPNVTFISAELSQGQYSEEDGIVFCELGSLGNGESATINIKVLPMVEGNITNIVYVSANEEDPNISNNTAIQATMIFKAICIETKKILDSCYQKDKIEEVFNLPYCWNPEVNIDCSIRDIICSVEKVTEPNDEGNVVACIKVKALVNIKIEYYNFTRTLNKVFWKIEKITLYNPEGDLVTCSVKDSSCKCEQIKRYKVRCTVDFTLIVKSSTVVQIEAPYINICDPKICEEK
ncbi:beta-propeller fold lactonase family protein [Clostridium botulinum]|nr:beta-propeller fold lactonase family protein [Clostridium botulinum]